MKDNIDEKRIKEVVEQDLASLMIMCGESDKNFFCVPDGERKSEDYVRLLIISIALNLRGAFLRLIAEADRKKRMKNVEDGLEKVKNDYQGVTKWVNDFISTIPDPICKQVALEIWAEKKSKINKNAFDLSQIK